MEHGYCISAVARSSSSSSTVCSTVVVVGIGSKQRQGLKGEGELHTKVEL